MGIAMSEVPADEALLEILEAEHSNILRSIEGVDLVALRRQEALEVAREKRAEMKALRDWVATLGPEPLERFDRVLASMRARSGRPV